MSEWQKVKKVNSPDEAENPIERVVANLEVLRDALKNRAKQLDQEKNDLPTMVNKLVDTHQRMSDAREAWLSEKNG